jgi:hypothetical protein
LQPWCNGEPITLVATRPTVGTSVGVGTFVGGTADGSGGFESAGLGGSAKVGVDNGADLELQAVRAAINIRTAITLKVLLGNCWRRILLIILSIKILGSFVRIAYPFLCTFVENRYYFT